jgi:uncharacterized protein (TIGR04255 family)
VSFDPAADEHAIIEVVFGLTLSRPFAPNEIERLVKNHGRWRSELPRLSRTGGVPFFPAEFPGSQGFHIAAQGGVSFERIKPDGTMDWRIFVENNNIFVNCLSYTRWAEIWPKARRYLVDVLQVAEAPDSLISGNSLQYIDGFKWVGDVADYDVHRILKPSDHVPKSVFSKGLLWHLHQGWFEGDSNGRILERAQIDAVMNEFGEPLLKIDILMHHQLASFYTSSQAIDNGWISTTFENMHSKNKRLLHSFLSDEMAERIKLNVA